MNIYLESIRINNFALLEDVYLEVGKGFNVITGETGAGKSILVGALSMVLGESVGREIVRSSTEFCEVEAVFGGDMNDDMKLFLNEKGLEDGELILRRKFYSAGKSKCYINDRHVTLTTLKELGNLLIDIHSQNQHQALLKKSNQMKILDRFSGAEKVLIDIRKEWKVLNELKAEKDTKLNARDLTDREIERLKSEIFEIDSANLYNGIDEEIDREYKILSNYGLLNSGVEELYGSLYEEDGAVVERLSESSKKLDDLVGIDSGLKEVEESMQKAVCEVESACENLRSYIDNTEYDSGRLDEVVKAREGLLGLKRKFSNEIEDILQYRNEVSEKVSAYDNHDDIIKNLDNEIKQVEGKLKSLTSKLTGMRTKAAKKLEKIVIQRLSMLGMKGASFKIDLRNTEIGPTGSEDVEFFINPNPGQNDMELSKIASGGEISRIMLAIKSALAGCDNIPILVFDEIDTGIGATIATPVGKEISKLSKFHQVIVITHLPQIAGCSDVHVKVEKKVDSGVTRTFIRALEDESRVNEIARMFGGEHGDIATMHAREILKKAEER